MKSDHVIACFVGNAGRLQGCTGELFKVPNSRTGPILLGMLHEETNGERALFVQSCNHRPNRAAWLAGSCVVGDGSLHMITPADPLLFLIPSFPKCPDTAFCEQHFCDIEELFASQVAPSCQFIRHAMEASQLSNVCDTKSVDGQVYYRFSFVRIIAWLHCKTEQTLRALETNCPSVISQDLDSDMLYAATMTTECLQLEWETHLIQSLGLATTSLRSQKRGASDYQPRLPEKLAKVEKGAELSSKQKAAISREASRVAAFSKVAKGSAKIASFFKKQ